MQALLILDKLRQNLHMMEPNASDQLPSMSYFHIEKESTNGPGLVLICLFTTKSLA